MTNHDDIEPEALRADLTRFAELIGRLDEEGELLAATPRLIKMMGDLRRKLFEYEVRSTRRLRPGDDDEEGDDLLEDSERIVREALEREEEAEDDWSTGWSPEEGEEG